MKKILKLIFALFPSCIKCIILKQQGHIIGANVHIGLSYIDCKKIIIGDNARIGNFNIFKNLQTIKIGEKTNIGKYNIFTCSNYYLKKYPNDAGRLTIGSNSSITMRHYFDIQHKIFIGDHSLIAGIHTVLFTHQKGLSILDEAKPIIIENRIYIGANCTILPGSCIKNNIIIGAGSTVSGILSESFSLYISPRAIAIKKLSNKTPFFTDPFPTKIIN